MTAANLLAYVSQVTLIVLVCAGLPRLVGLRSPGVQYAFWRTLLVVCLLLPIAQPWQTAEMAFMPGPSQPPPPVSATAPPSQPAPAAAGFDWVAAARIVILTGIAARLAWIALGMVRLRRMRKRVDGAATGFEDLQQTISSRAPILWSSEVRHPVTFGVLKPVVLLPVALKTADLAAQRAVVAHELHHVKRRDWGWVVAEEMIRSAFWFHPAMWWLVSRVQLARETVVDELSILATNARRTYLDTLLAFADDTGFASSPAFSARRHLFHRVMLLSKEGEMSSIRVAVGSCVLVLALGASAWGAVEAFPLHGDWREPPAVAQQAPRDQKPVASRIDIDFVDAELRAVLRSFESASGLKIIIDPEVQGRVNILMHDVPWDQALDRVLRSQKLGYTVEGNAIRIVPLESVGGRQSQQQRDRLREAARQVMVFSPKPQPPPPAPEPQGSVMEFSPAPTGGAAYDALIDLLKPVRIGGGFKAPMKIRDVKPVYPPIAQSARVQGVVILEVVIDAGGSVVDARILRSIPLLDQAAFDAVKQWEFTPTLMNGMPTPVMMTVTVNFKLD